MSQSTNSNSTEQMEEHWRLPDDEYGPVRDCHHPLDPLEPSRKPVLPCPSRELAFSARQGCWRYVPSQQFSDRVGAHSSEIPPPFTTFLSQAWGDVQLASNFSDVEEEDDETWKRLQSLSIDGAPAKRPRTQQHDAPSAWRRRIPTSVTIASGSTVSSLSTSSSGSSSAMVKAIPKAARYTFR